MNKIFKFAVLYLSIILLLFVLREFFAISIPFLHSLLIQLLFLSIIFLVVKKDLIKSNKIYILLFFYLLGGIVFFVSLFGAIQYVYTILLLLYFGLATILVWKGLIKKFFWILLLILVVQIGSLFFPSNRCNLNYKGGFVYSCDCKGLLKANSFVTNCIGERTCYKYSESVKWVNGESAIKQETDCSEIDNHDSKF